MRKVILQMVTSLDGYVAGPDGDLSWIFPNLDDEIRTWINKSLSKVDVQLLGRVAYLEQAGYWPTATEELAGVMNASEKLVFSHTLTELPNPVWPNSRLATDPTAEITRLKSKPGGDLYIPGGASFAQSLAAANLIDEYRLIQPPVVLGTGTPLFTSPLNLSLITSHPYTTGTLIKTYHPT
ncbi:dihydrofolate reductase family protein [Actinocorallia sp. A-T 12471]|uniref:dihydrofolate reductase family protein n=1 Tax=Actinocorallia sp. A-T 12471 TaxID=3089813 RepID=UPI0029CD094F|nr:dihydrofolate reductase family protein [Actinocorallia sp. A-T 12471]MDX6741621.1 dihydrofolate reductase family protein [Actinocorallia sp. A-T 12471]